MSKTPVKKFEKRLIHLSKEQQEKMAAQSAQKIQAFIGEASQVQSRRFELASALLIAHVTKSGITETAADVVEQCRAVAALAVDADAKQKWSDLKVLFVEMGVAGPQPHLEWAAKQVGVTLFDEPVEEEGASIIVPATPEQVKVIQ